MYKKMGEMLLELAQESTDGRFISVLEGGYNLTVLAKKLFGYSTISLKTSSTAEPASRS